jgi:hypothetical protein
VLQVLVIGGVVAGAGAFAYVVFRYPKLAIVLSAALLALAAGIDAEGLQQIFGVATAAAVVRWLAVAV